ncbi:unnamed protein product, partial [Linum tenue]
MIGTTTESGGLYYFTTDSNSPTSLPDPITGPAPESRWLSVGFYSTIHDIDICHYWLG